MVEASECSISLLCVCSMCEFVSECPVNLYIHKIRTSSDQPLELRVLNNRKQYVIFRLTRQRIPPSRSNHRKVRSFVRFRDADFRSIDDLSWYVDGRFPRLFIAARTESRNTKMSPSFTKVLRSSKIWTAEPPLLNGFN